MGLQPQEPVRIGPIPHQGKFGEYSLVLRSMEIVHGVSWQPDGLYITVDPHDVERTQNALRSYEEENAAARAQRPRREVLPFGPTLAGWSVALVLLLFFLATGSSADATRWMQAGTADNRLIFFFGQPWRVLTALFLHADYEHIGLNAVGSAIFINFLMRRLGIGLSLLLTLLGGALGNMANAAFHAFVLHTAHRSIGESTALFAIVGLLAITQLYASRSTGSRRFFDYAGPIVGGFVLLGAGTKGGDGAMHVDHLAHLFGLLCGGLLGTVGYLLGPRVKLRAVQWSAGILCVALIAGSWALAASRS